MTKHNAIGILAALLICVWACKKKNPEIPAEESSPCKNTYTTYYDGNKGDDIVMAFGNQRRLESIASNGSAIRYVYENGRLTVYNDEDAEAHVDLANGRAVRISRAGGQEYHELSYNTEGYLSSVKMFLQNQLFTTFELFYENGNLTRMRERGVGLENVTQETTYTYQPDQADEALLAMEVLDKRVLNFYIPHRLLGRASRNVIASSTYVNVNPNYVDRLVRTYTYQKDESGRITSRKEKETSIYESNGKTERMEYNHEMRLAAGCR
ncbi:hypothetical protein C7T94_11190 [Pedobacter yulinensis]|uniref:Uncharacterized protein n=1 Tax=Pedobacter yulinensis TaxID=2126353 RepID=A0A2T3HL19_9SPHI|nr:DUF4595 domain-containing protein [Pedobacter yulinensis]PST83158.1 hypothetical protein C7T94_11190 [Pedobacter yulinensis]